MGEQSGGLDPLSHRDEGSVCLSVSRLVLDSALMPFQLHTPACPGWHCTGPWGSLSRDDLSLLLRDKPGDHSLSVCVWALTVTAPPDLPYQWQALFPSTVVPPSACLVDGNSSPCSSPFPLQETALFPVCPVGHHLPTLAMLERYVFLLILLTNTVTSVKSNARHCY